MSPAHPRVEITHENPFAVVLRDPHADKDVVLRTAHDPDRASTAFHVVRAWLIGNQVTGDLLLVHHGEDVRTLLWEPLR